MAIWYLNQTAPTNGNGSSSNPFNSITSARNAAQSGDSVYVTPEVIGGDATIWSVSSHNSSDGIIVNAGVTWRVDPAHCAPTSANRRILPHFAQTNGTGRVFSVKANGSILGFRCSFGNQTQINTTRVNMIEIEGDGVIAKGIVYWPTTHAWSDDPYYLYQTARQMYTGYPRLRFFMVQASNCLLEDIATRLASWNALSTTDWPNPTQITIRFCSLQGHNGQGVLMAVGPTSGPNTPLRGNLVEFCDIGSQTEEDCFASYSNDPSGDPNVFPRVHGLVIRNCMLQGISGENAMDPKNGQCHLYENNIVYGHPGCNDGPYVGGGAFIAFDAIQGTTGDYAGRWIIVRNNVVVFNAKGIAGRSRAIYNNLVIHNQCHGPFGDWEPEDQNPNKHEHHAMSVDSPVNDAWLMVNNIMGQHFNVGTDPVYRPSFENGMTGGRTSTARINNNCYFNDQNGLGGPRFVTNPDTSVSHDFAYWKSTIVAPVQGGDADAYDATNDLPILANADNPSHLIGTDYTMYYYDGYDWALHANAPQALKTGGGGQVAATQSSSGTTITVERSWAFYSQDRYGNPGQSHGIPIFGDYIMNMRTGDIRQIVAMPTVIADILNGEMTLDSPMNVQSGDMIAWVPPGWATSTVPMGLMTWNGAGILAASGQGGTFTGSTEPPPVGGTTDYIEDDFAGVAGTEVRDSVLEADPRGKGWSQAGSMQLDGSGNLELLDYTGDFPTCWICTGISDPQIRMNNSRNGSNEYSAIVFATDVILNGEPNNGYRIVMRHPQNDIRLLRFANNVGTSIQDFPVTFDGSFEDIAVLYNPSTGLINIRKGPTGTPIDSLESVGTWTDPNPYTVGTVAGISRISVGTPNPLVSDFKVGSISDTAPSFPPEPEVPTNVIWQWNTSTSGTLSWDASANSAFYVVYIDGYPKEKTGSTSIVLTGLNDANSYDFRVTGSSSSGCQSDFSGDPADITYSIQGGTANIIYTIAGGNVGQTHAIQGGERAFQISPYGGGVTQDDSATGDPLVRTAVVWNKVGERPTNGVETTQPFWAFDLYQDTVIRVTTPGWSYAQIRLTDGLGLYGSWQMWEPDKDIPASNYIDKGLFANAQRVFIECRATP